ncbi:hypothetical protein ACFTWH_12165 [Streptomyces sp. NPDC057011]|uniref:hypothetical protein n=1 Tax=unclassified Streptomyces TaxID=2593676 RepID=UPI00363C6127
MTIYVSQRTLDALEDRVDKNQGAAVVHNWVIRSLEGRERLRLERLQTVCSLLRRRGLETFPRTPRWPNEWNTLVIYRPELTTVRLHAVGQSREALLFILDELNKSDFQQNMTSTRRFRRELLKLSAARAQAAKPAIERLYVA